MASLRAGASLILLLTVYATNAQDAGPMEIAFSFDTTGSMYPVIDEVRRVLVDMISRLQSDIPGIRIAVFAHGDYEDSRNTYDSKWIDFTTDSQSLQDFVNHVERTGGGDLPEAYELVLHQAQTELSWSQNSKRSLVMIGDADAHEPSYQGQPYPIDWREEASKLNDMGVRIYSIKALEYNTQEFYKGIANITGGYFLRLKNFDSIFDFIMAISYRELELDYLEQFRKEVQSRPSGMTPELRKLFKTLRQQPVAERKQILPSVRPQITMPPVTAAPSTVPPPKYNAKMDIYSIHIESDISYRFATTTVVSQLANRADESTEAVFILRLPKPAFISNFTMEIDGVSYPGIVKEKEAAKRTYNRAKAKGESAAHVAAVPRNTNTFKVSVNVAPESKVTFTMIYEELLERRLGIYEHVINLDPGQVVRDFQVNINIHESRDITFLHVPPLRNDLMNTLEMKEENQDVVIERPAANIAKIMYAPSVKQQEEASEQGIRGQFVTQYDVKRTRDSGEIQVVDGYFVHFFAPEGLTAASKNIIFVLDVSGSMSGEKIAQLKDAMGEILSQLRPGDFFGIVKFSSFTRAWKTHLLPADDHNIDEAKEWIRRLFVAGGTNINQGMLQGIEILNNHTEFENPQAPSTSILVFLTDGKATDGVTDKKTILDNVKEANNDRYTVFSLGFGEHVDFNFLQKMSAQNRGFARKIYADSDASLQLQGFYGEIACPLLSNVNINYLDEKVDNNTLTTSSYRTFFNGSEIVVAGLLNDLDTRRFDAQIEAYAAGGPLVFNMIVDVDKIEEKTVLPEAGHLRDNLERIWAYLTIKDIFKKSLETSDPDEKNALKSQALEMSLKYHFVTPVTSLVVTKPEEEDVEDVEDPDEKKEEEKKDPSGKPSRYSGSRSRGESDRLVDSAGERAGAHYDISHKKRVDSSRSAGRGGGRGGGGGFADNDPHFIVNVKGSKMPICFDVMGSIGDIYQLIHDPKINLTVNGLIVGKKNPEVPKEKRKTYFGKIAIHVGGFPLTIAPTGIRVNNTSLKWRDNRTLGYPSVGVVISKPKRNEIHIRIGDNIEIVLVRHQVSPTNPNKVDFLGFYLQNDKGITSRSHGLIGQFRSIRVSINDTIDNALLSSDRSASLSFPRMPHRDHVTVYAGRRENMVERKKLPCWFVRQDGRKLLDGRSYDYKVPRLHYQRLAPKIKRKTVI